MRAPWGLRCTGTVWVLRGCSRIRYCTHIVWVSVLHRFGLVLYGCCWHRIGTVLAWYGLCASAVLVLHQCCDGTCWLYWYGTGPVVLGNLLVRYCYSMGVLLHSDGRLKTPTTPCNMGATLAAPRLPASCRTAQATAENHTEPHRPSGYAFARPAVRAAPLRRGRGAEGASGSGGSARRDTTSSGRWRGSSPSTPRSRAPPSSPSAASSCSRRLRLGGVRTRDGVMGRRAMAKRSQTSDQRFSRHKLAGRWSFEPILASGTCLQTRGWICACEGARLPQARLSLRRRAGLPLGVLVDTRPRCPAARGSVWWRWSGSSLMCALLSVRWSTAIARASPLAEGDSRSVIARALAE